VFSNPDGLDTGVFSITGRMRNMMQGQEIPAGLDITVNGTMTQKGPFKVAIFGEKPYTGC